MFVISTMLASTACVGPRYSTCQIIGATPSPIPHPINTKNCLSTRPDKPVGFFAAVLGCLTTPFKAAGVSGWTDYGYFGEAIGQVVQSRLSTDRFFTVDIALESMRVEQTPLGELSGRYLRAEIYQGQTPVARSTRALCHPLVLIRGKLVWDGDGHGHLEIHPQHPDDYRILSLP